MTITSYKFPRPAPDRPDRDLLDMARETVERGNAERAPILPAPHLTELSSRANLRTEDRQIIDEYAEGIRQRARFADEARRAGRDEERQQEKRPGKEWPKAAEWFG